MAADLTRDDLARLRELRAASIAADEVYFASGAHRRRQLRDAAIEAEEAFEAAWEAAFDALFAAAERDLDRRDGLVFGPWLDGERHAVAEDGAHYTLFAMRDPEDPMTRWETTVWTEEPNEGDCATEAEAIEKAREHDRARRGKS